MKKLLDRAAVLLILLWVLPVGASAAKLLVPVGQVIGLELGNNTVTVAAFAEEGCGDGLRVGDRILNIDGQAVKSAEDVRKALECSDGTVELRVLREGKEQTLRVSPRITGEGPRLGVYLRCGVTGIGTVTFYDPQTGSFGALGHGVNDGSGSLLHMVRGSAYPASVLSVRPGRSGEPGQLMGTLENAAPIGTLEKNTAQGVFGTVRGGFSGEALPVGAADRVHTGKAVIRSTVQGATPQEYSVEILKIYPRTRAGGRNMLIKVTDERLLQTTGGIVQGMSGSPIIQDGKLVGAVTHVLVNDPTTGYGIFIENMLDAAS